MLFTAWGSVTPVHPTHNWEDGPTEVFKVSMADYMYWTYWGLIFTPSTSPPPPQSQVTERRVIRERAWLGVFPQYLLFQRRSQQRWSPAFALSAAKENTTYLVPASVFSFKTFTFNIYFEENFLEHPLSFNYLSCLFSKCKLPTVSCQSLLPFNMDISNSWSVCF